jgi:hypothetical protein
MKTGTQLRDEAIQQVEDNADADWLAEADAALEYAASRYDLFTSDDIWDLLTSTPREPRAMGAVLRRGQAAGLIKPTETWWQSRRAASHRRPLRVWKPA